MSTTDWYDADRYMLGLAACLVVRALLWICGWEPN